MKIKRIEINNVFSYIFAFSLIYQSGSVMAAVICDGFVFRFTRIMLLVLPFLCICLYRTRNKYISFLFIGLMFGTIPLMINYFLFPEGVFRLAYKIVLLFLSSIIYMCLGDSNIDLREKIYNVIIFLAFVSLIIYFLAELLKLSLPYTIVYQGNSYRYKDYFGLFFTYHYALDFPRLSGLFWEPGVYQIYLNSALFYYIFNEKKNLFQFVILIFSVIFTQSASGYCITAFLLVIYIVRSPLITKNSRKYIALIGLIFATGIALCVLSIKIKNTSGAEGSYTLRVGDIINGLRIFIKHPVFGVGYGNESPFIELDSFGRGSSNGLISYLYMTGLVGLSVILIPFMANYKKSNNKVKQLIWMIVFVLFNSVEPIYNLPIVVFFVGVEYVYMLKKIRIEK